MNNSNILFGTTSSTVDTRKTLQEVFVQYERLIYSIAIKFTLDCDLLKDLCQVGFLGLKKAFERFDNTLATKLSTFASPYIRWEMINFLKEYYPQTNAAIDKSKLIIDSPEEEIENAEIYEIANAEIHNLTQTQARIIKKYFYDEFTVTEIAVSLNVSKAFVSKTIKSSLKKLRLNIEQQIN